MFKIKRQLKEHGIDVEMLAASPIIAQLAHVNRAIYVCKDGEGKIGIISIPETAWRFEGTILLENGFLILIDKKVASEWGI